MELYEIKEKVGSDPCLVLDFDFEATISETDAVFDCELKEFDTLNAAIKYANDLTALIEELTKTRNVVFRSKIHTTDLTLKALNNAVTINSTIVFGDVENFGRGFSIICPLPLADIKMFAIGINAIPTNNDTYMTLLRGSVSLL